MPVEAGRGGPGQPAWGVETALAWAWGGGRWVSDMSFCGVCSWSEGVFWQVSSFKGRQIQAQPVEAEEGSARSLMCDSSWGPSCESCGDEGLWVVPGKGGFTTVSGRRWEQETMLL